MYVHTVLESITLSARDAIIRFNTRLLEELPLESGVFFAMVKQASLFSGDTADRIAELSTRPEKVSYFLKHVIEPEADVYLPKLLGVMEESKSLDLMLLAYEIQAVMESGIFAYSVDKYSRTSIIRTPMCHFNVKSVQISEFVRISELSDKIS